MVRVFALIFIVYAALLGQQFTRITSGAVVTDGGDSRSVNWIDYDNDGDLDLFITNGPSTKANNFLYKNNGDGSFTKITNLSIVNDPGSYDGSSWADYDNDGHIDAYSATWWGQKNSLHRQYDGFFEKVTRGEITNDVTHSETASWGDYDNDGFVDLYLANSAVNKANNLYKNKGDGTFVKITSGPHVSESKTSRSVDWFDYDNDGDLDIFTANEGGEGNSLYRNLGNGVFESVKTGAIVTDALDSYGSSVGDIDNDGDLDLFVATGGNQNNALYVNNGDGSFTKSVTGDAVTGGGYSVGTAFGDIDNDGDLDLVVANAFGPGNIHLKNFLYLNNGGGTFSKVTSGAIVTDSGWSYGVAMGDYDRDGDLDIAFANCYGANQDNSLYRNNGNTNTWLTVLVKGTVSNRSGIGAKIKVKATINGNPVWQYRQVAGQSGYCGQNLESHFGLANATTIDSIVVIFPSGQTVVQTNALPNQLLSIEEPVPAGFLRGAFICDTLTGRTPLTVKFNDLSITHSSQPILSWQWDFNGDGIADATAQNTQFTYVKPDTYTVSLRVTNAATTDTAVAQKLIYVLRPISAPVITASYPMAQDTTIPKNGKISFKVFIVDTSDSPLKYEWYRNNVMQIGSSNLFNYASNFLLPAPRIDTFRVTISNDFHSIQKQWMVNVLNIVSSVDKEPMLPKYMLSQNHPNPFNPSTTIRFDIPENSEVSLILFDSIGREVRSIVNGTYPPGSYSVKIDATDLASGVYLYRLNAGTFVETKTMILMK